MPADPPERDFPGILHDRIAETSLEALSMASDSELLSEPVRAVIFAGGLGTRLAPYTSVLPKPLLPVGGRPIVEILLAQLEAAGFVDVTLCVGYLAHLIRAVLDHSERRTMTIEYVQEKHPFGTAGPLHLVPGLDDTFVAMNGDVLTTLDFGHLVRHHRASGNILTIATRRRKTKLDFGVLELDEEGPRRLSRFYEKPELTMTVSMGVYVMEPETLGYIPRGQPFDLPDLVKALLSDGVPVGSYPFDGFWLDIGRHDDYEEANRIWDAMAPLLLK